MPYLTELKDRLSVMSNLAEECANLLHNEPKEYDLYVLMCQIAKKTNIEAIRLNMDSITEPPEIEPKTNP